MSQEAIQTLNTWTPEDFEVALQTYAVGAPATTSLYDLPASIEVGPTLSERITALEKSPAARVGFEKMSVRGIGYSGGNRWDSWFHRSGDKCSVSSPEGLREYEISVLDCHWHPQDDPPSIEDAAVLAHQGPRAPFASVVISPNEAWMLVHTLETQTLPPEEIKEVVNTANQTIWTRARQLTEEYMNNGIVKDPMKTAQIEVLVQTCNKLGIGLYHTRRTESGDNNLPHFIRYQQ